MSTTKVATDILSQLANVLPTGTFLVFQMLAPLATNNGTCGKTEIALTSVMLVFLSILCCVSCFTDSYKAENGVSYHGFVTCKGLWNPHFQQAELLGTVGPYYKGGGSKYTLKVDDFVNAGLSVLALSTISLLTEPVTTCFYPHIPESIQKTVPILVGLLVAVVCAFGTTPRNGIGFSEASSTPPPPRPHA